MKDPPEPRFGRVNTVVAGFRKLQITVIKGIFLYLRTARQRLHSCTIVSSDNLTSIIDYR